MPTFNGSIVPTMPCDADAKLLPFPVYISSLFPPSNSTGFEYQNTTICHFGTRNFYDAVYDICPLNLAHRTPRHLSTIEFKRFNIANFFTVTKLFSDFTFGMPGEVERSLSNGQFSCETRIKCLYIKSDANKNHSTH